jgi:hypothetical protein
MKTLKSILTIIIVLCTNTIYSQESSNSEYNKLMIDPKTNCQLRYYYYPNLQAYFDNLKNVFYYQDNGSWQTSEKLPENYGGYSLYKMNHIIIDDFDDDEPQQLINTHKKKYPYNFKSGKM